MRHIPSLVYLGVWKVAIRHKTQQKAAIAAKTLVTLSRFTEETLKLQDGNLFVT
jgi:hypothetical protein